MNVRDFRIGWRLLLKEPGYSTAVVLGLAVGFAVCFLLLGFVRYSFTYNVAIPESGHIFDVKERRNLLRAPMGGWPLLYALAGVAFVALCATARYTLVAARMSPALARQDY